MNNLKRRPAFHITAGDGWINDPNGLVKWNGVYHAFYQHYPYDVRWNDMHWGHKISKDLLHWENLPIALTPGDDGEKDGCFSGSAIIHNDKMYLLYTGFTRNEDGESIRQLQCLASSDDGIHFTKHGVVIGEEDLPREYAPCDFRDPQVWKENDIFYAVVAARRKEGKGRILLFKSNDLFKWEFVSSLFDEDSKGIMIECPDYISKLGLLLCCEQLHPAEGIAHLNWHTTKWYTGKIINNKFIKNKEGIVDYGFDFYAPQTYLEDNIMIGWLDMWEREKPTEKMGFSGTLTIPRKIEVIDDELYQTPLIAGKKVLETRVQKYFKDSFRIGTLKLTIKDLNSFELKLRKKENKYTILKLKDNNWVFDRSKSGVQVKGGEKDEDSLNGIRRMPYKDKTIHEVYIVSDEFSLEIFIDGLSCSNAIYPDIDANELELVVDSEDCMYQKFDF